MRSQGGRPASAGAASGSAWSDTPPALVNGVPLTWHELRPAMIEAGGGVALQEAVLDRLVRAEAQRRGLAISDADIAAEHERLAGSVSRQAALSSADAERVVEDLRRARGLGPQRYRRLLERNALLRRLVADTVVIREDDLRQVYAIEHGERYRARVIVVGSQAEASRLRQQLLDAGPLLALRFADAAARFSADASAARGGLLEPISPADPAYPAVIREALARLTPGELSPILGLDRGCALVLVEERIPADDVPFEEVAEDIRRRVRLREERLAMEALARRLLDEADLVITDSALDWSWRALRPPP